MLANVIGPMLHILTFFWTELELVQDSSDTEVQVVRYCTAGFLGLISCDARETCRECLNAAALLRCKLTPTIYNYHDEKKKTTC